MEYISRRTNKELMADAREALGGRWGIAIGTVVVCQLIMMAVNFVPVLGGFASLFISGPLVLGLIIFFLSLSRGEDAQLSQLFEGFNRFGVALGAYLLKTLFVMLWSLLLIIPGIIAGLSYSMTFYIIAEDDSIGPLDAIRKSQEMMMGNKWKLFCLGWRFFGWMLLCILTLGIGFLWLSPYMQTTYAKFYDDLKNSAVE